MGAPLVGFPPFGLSSPCWWHVIFHYWEKLHILYKQWTCWFGPPICKTNMWGFMEMSYSSAFLAPPQISSVGTPALCVSPSWKGSVRTSLRALHLSLKDLPAESVRKIVFTKACCTQRNGDLGRSLEATCGEFVGQKESTFIPQYCCTGNTLDPTPASPLTPNEIETSDCPIRVHPYSSAVSGEIIFPKVLCSLLAGWPWANCSLKLTRSW